MLSPESSSREHRTRLWNDESQLNASNDDLKSQIPPRRAVIHLDISKRVVYRGEVKKNKKERTGRRVDETSCGCNLRPELTPKESHLSQ